MYYKDHATVPNAAYPSSVSSFFLYSALRPQESLRSNKLLNRTVPCELVGNYLCCSVVICVVLFIVCVVLLSFVLFCCHLCCSVYVFFCCYLCCSVYVLFCCYLCCSVVICVVLLLFCLCVVLLLFVLFYVLFVCKCVLYYYHQVTTQLQLTNISYHINFISSHPGMSRDPIQPHNYKVYKIYSNTTFNWAIIKMYFQPYISARCFDSSVWSHLQAELF